MCVANLFNSIVWFFYAILVNDIPFFTSTGISLIIMTVNLTFYLWAVDSIQSDQIKGLINFIKIAFPIEDSKEQEFNSLL